MAHEMQIEVIAEGVKTANHLDFLKGLNCERYQGYLFTNKTLAERPEPSGLF
jgi:EAL domain-containing protein (putative c-di-GMP-specific phosphodiesterase class I)